MQEAAWVLSNIAAGLVEHKQLIYSSEAVPLLLKLLYATPFDIRKEVAYVLGNLCVAPTKDDGKPSLILEHMVSLVEKGCLPGFIDLIRSADIEAARLGLQFTELVRDFYGCLNNSFLYILIRTRLLHGLVSKSGLFVCVIMTKSNLNREHTKF